MGMRAMQRKHPIGCFPVYGERARRNKTGQARMVKDIIRDGRLCVGNLVPARKLKEVQSDLT
jgi:hypothetical protein